MRGDGAQIDELRVDGGMVVNDPLMQRLADTVGVPVERPKVTETTALGAAFLAGLQAGLWPSLDALSADLGARPRLPARPRTPPRATAAMPAGRTPSPGAQFVARRGQSVSNVGGSRRHSCSSPPLGGEARRGLTTVFERPSLLPRPSGVEEHEARLIDFHVDELWQRTPSKFAAE